MHKCDVKMCQKDKHRVICIDFAATLNLQGSQTKHFSMNNHAVVCIFMFLVFGGKKHTER